MFPLLAFGAIALGGYSVTKTCAAAVFGAKTLGTSRRLDEARAREALDVNVKFEKSYAEHMRKKYGLEQPEGEDQALALGLTDIVEVEVTKDLLPAKYHDLAGYWYVTRRDEIILWYFLIRVQSKEGVGPVGEYVHRVAQKSGIPASSINSVLFGAKTVEQSLESVVRTIREMSTNRHDSPLHRKALGWSQQ